jgi:hypothetical protein
VIGWLLDEPAGIAVLTVLASAIVGAAMWAAYTAVTLLVAAVVSRLLWLAGRRRPRPPMDAS